MEHFRPRKYAGPEVWARVRECYIAGETGPALARRFDVGLANLRKKAMSEGWTRNRIAERRDLELLGMRPSLASSARAAAQVSTAAEAEVDIVLDDPARPVDPHQARAHAVAQAAALLAQGRAFEATALLKAAETLGRVMESIPDVAGAEAEEARSQEQIRAVINALIIRNVDAILSADAKGTDGQGLSQTFELAAFHWRARRMGPEVAAEDRERMRGQTYWDADGMLIPLSTQDPDGAVAEALDEGEAR